MSLFKYANIPILCSSASYNNDDNNTKRTQPTVQKGKDAPSAPHVTFQRYLNVLHNSSYENAFSLAVGTHIGAIILSGVYYISIPRNGGPACLNVAS